MSYIENEIGVELPISHERQKLRQWGFDEARTYSGNSMILPNLFVSVVSWFKNEHSSEYPSQVEKINSAKSELVSAQEEKQKVINYALPINQQKQKQVELKIESSNIEFSLQHSDGSQEKIVNYFQISILLAVGIFLFLFYSSLIYSAFYSNLGMDLSTSLESEISFLFNSILNPNAINLSLQAGWVAFLSVLTGPFVVILFGYLMKCKKDNKIQFYVFLLFGVFLEFILAYVLTQKLHEASYLIGLTNTQWIFSMIFVDPKFYLVFILGFATYYSWSVLFESFIQGKRSSKNQTLKIDLFKVELQHLISEHFMLQAQVAELDVKINKIHHQIKQLESLSEMQVYSINDLKSVLNAWYAGWVEYLINHDNQMTNYHLVQSKMLFNHKIEEIEMNFHLNRINI